MIPSRGLQSYVSRLSCPSYDILQRVFVYHSSQNLFGTDPVPSCTGLILLSDVEEISYQLDD